MLRALGTLLEARHIGQAVTSMAWVVGPLAKMCVNLTVHAH